MKNSDSKHPISDAMSKSTGKSTGSVELEAGGDIQNSSTLNSDSYSKKAAKNAKKMAKRIYVNESPIHGKGLFAAKSIKAGVSLGRLHGMLTDKDGTYVLWLDKHTGLELTNEFRFINHDANPNCLRAIKKDEELTHDYGW